MKGTILDFLKLATEKTDLTHELVELAAKHDFEFAVEELTDAELEDVSGGVTLPRVPIDTCSLVQSAIRVDYLELLAGLQHNASEVSSLNETKGE